MHGVVPLRDREFMTPQPISMRTKAATGDRLPWRAAEVPVRRPVEVVYRLWVVSSCPESKVGVALRRGEGDSEIGCYPNAVVLKDAGFLTDTCRWFEEMFPDDASFPVCTDQPCGLDLARCFVAIEVVDRHSVRVLVASDHFTA
jgi:hypothetical protein